MIINIKSRSINRELSWLSFNHRVLQEAMDERVPLIERLRFLGIFSNNLDEFFRVRVATMKRITSVSKKKELIGNKTAGEVLDEIHGEVVRQKAVFDQTYAKIITQLTEHNIHILNETQLNEEQQQFVDEYYREVVAPLLVPIMLGNVPDFPELRDKSIYLAVRIYNKKKGIKKQVALIEVPSERTTRFIVLPEEGEKKFIIFLDDLIRFNMNKIFGIFEYDRLEAYMIKITRDAELELDADISKGFYERIKRSLKQRKTGDPVRFLHDRTMPEGLLRHLIKGMQIEDESNIIPGGRYHNSKDFMKFPTIGPPELHWEKLVQTEHTYFTRSRSVLAAIQRNDILIHFPYQHFRAMVHFLREAAIHPHVKEIKITLYRVARESRVLNALISAVKNGKSVTAVIELRARFDEENNLEWSKRLHEAGIKVIYGVPELKVHCKLALVTTVHEGEEKHHVVVSTGNFNENTAKLYSDLAVFTCNKEIVDEAVKVFNFIEKPYINVRFRSLLVAPAAMRSKLLVMLNREIKNAKEGRRAEVFLKMNSLVDETLIRKLYQASDAGVRVRLIIRGICSIISGEPGLSENIQARSIIDRFLEHSRIFIFANGGNEEVYISSADWMERNLDYRVEVGCPIFDKALKKEIKDLMELQWRDNTKARIIDAEQTNPYVERTPRQKEVRAQKDICEIIAKHQETLR